VDGGGEWGLRVVSYSWIEYFAKHQLYYHLIITNILGGRDHPNFTDGGTEEQRDTVTCPKSQGV
jgi:hypothetical protein